MIGDPQAMPAAVRAYRELLDRTDPRAPGVNTTHETLRRLYVAFGEAAVCAELDRQYGRTVKPNYDDRNWTDGSNWNRKEPTP